MKKLIILGTGNAMVTKVYNTCFLVELDNGDLFMTDAGGGNGIFRQLELVNADYKRIRNMFVTHGHTDHILGVIWMMRKIADLMNKGRYEGIFNIYCHDVVADMLLKMCQMVLKKKDMAQIGKGIIINEVKDGDVVNISGIQLSVFDIFSTKAKQFGYTAKFQDGLTLACLGDEPYNDACRKYVEGCDWMMTEAFCKYDDRDIFKPYEKNHSTAKEASELAEKLGIKNLILYHTEDKTIATRKAAYGAEARRYFTGNVYVPNDLDVIELG